MCQGLKVTYQPALMSCRMLDEDAVVAMYAHAYRQLNQRFEPERCRTWFRGMKEKMNMGMGMGMPGVGRMMGMPM